MAEQSTSTGRRKNKALKEEDFARKNIAPNDGISKISFFEAINTQGCISVFHELDGNMMSEPFKGFEGKGVAGALNRMMGIRSLLKTPSF